MSAQEWFDANPKGAAAVQRYVDDRLTGKDAGQLKDLKAHLVAAGFTASRRSLSRYIASLGGKLPPKPKSEKAEKIKRPPNETWERDHAWIAAGADAPCWVITSAVCHTEPNHEFFEALQEYTTRNSGQLFVIPLRYKNPTSQREAKANNLPVEAWDSVFHPYLVENDFRLGDHNIKVMASWKIQATAPTPVTGQMSAVSKGASAIFGHTQLSMRSTPSTRGGFAKTVWSSGCATLPEFSNTTRGKMATFHHSNSAVVVESRDGYFLMREITWDGEKFADQGNYHYADGSVEPTRPEAILLGDSHVREMDPGFRKATWGETGMIATLRPKRVYEGDVFSAESVSGHEMGKRISEAKRAISGNNSLAGEGEELAQYVRDTETDAYDERLWIHSNHNDMLDRWLQNGSGKIEPLNLMLFHELSYRVLKDHAEGSIHREALEIWMAEYAPDVHEHIHWLKKDDKSTIAGVEMGMHGHLGADGSRGSPQGFSMIDVRCMVGHIHRWMIWKGVYVVGTGSRLKLSYTGGPSSWVHANAFLYDNGRRQMAQIVDGEW